MKISVIFFVADYFIDDYFIDEEVIYVVRTWNGSI